MSDATGLTQDEYREARGLLAYRIVNRGGYYQTEAPESSDYMLAERLLDSGVIDLAELTKKVG